MDGDADQVSGPPVAHSIRATHRRASSGSAQAQCLSELKGGCYRLTYRPRVGRWTFEGTLRVDRTTPDRGPDDVIISGDLYYKPLTNGSSGSTPAPTTSIPIFRRELYHSYLAITYIAATVRKSGPYACEITLAGIQHGYVHPVFGSYQGSFPCSRERNISITVHRIIAPGGAAVAPSFEGSLSVGGVEEGRVTLEWITDSFRRASLVIDTLQGSQPPGPVPNGGVTEDFDAAFRLTGWHLAVQRNSNRVPVPAGVNPNACWRSADLHGLMTSVTSPSSDLDSEWKIHLLVVPGALRCDRGQMFDAIGDPREGCVSYSDDGYPSGESDFYGTANNRLQRQVPRAYLRSALHEVTHTFNQIHQNLEQGDDNSIMTTTPSVADVLAETTSGDPGVFPGQINLRHNSTVRHHLNHMPDPVIRPGGWPFQSWQPSALIEASDGLAHSPAELRLDLGGWKTLALGEPALLEWTLTNAGDEALPVPSDVSLEALFTTITVLDSHGRARLFRPFVIRCESASVSVLDPGQQRRASTRIFWSTAGFAFNSPGPYRVTVAIAWSWKGVPMRVTNATDIFVEYPTEAVENQAVQLVMHPDVGKWVALGGAAYHLPEAVRRLRELEASVSPPPLARGFKDLLPDPERPSGGGTKRVDGPQLL